MELVGTADYGDYARLAGDVRTTAQRQDIPAGYSPILKCPFGRALSFRDIQDRVKSHNFW